jgi:hypothetical protein
MTCRNFSAARTCSIDTFVSASQDIRRRVATCFVAVNITSQDVAGYYTLTATSVALNALSFEIAKKLPRYPVVPAALLGRLAVSRRYRGQGLGGILLADALKRTARAELGGQVRRLCLPIGVALRRLADRP